MTELEWLKSDLPDAVEYVAPRSTNRKLRLFACACCRSFFNRTRDAHSRKAVEIAEEHADGKVSAKMLYVAYRRRRKEDEAIQSAIETVTFRGKANTWICGLIFRLETEFSSQFELYKLMLRDIIGPLPFRPKTIAPSLLTWSNSTVPRIAQRIYEERAFDEMPILGDSLESAGCVDTEILEHCRRPGLVHVRGCWVVDLLLGKN